MVQLTLPRNSQIKDGKVWPKPEGATNLRESDCRSWDGFGCAVPNEFWPQNRVYR